MTIEQIKQRFGIIGNSSLLNRALDIAMQVSGTDLTVLITGESGVGKEVFPKIIHSLSARKHGEYIPINCGAIPEGTIDSELFGHEKGSFTDARTTRKGYFEVGDNGTLFLDEVAELPLQTQVRLLRVLETGEFMRVGSSKVIKTNVRVVAATNVNIPEAIEKGKFREDLFYRLNTVPIYIPPLRKRKEDIYLLFRKFAADFSSKYQMPTIRLNDDAVSFLETYKWKGNIRQLKNITEQISIIEKNRLINLDTLKKYLPEDKSSFLPVLIGNSSNRSSEYSERDLLYKVLFDMKKDIVELKKVVGDITNVSPSNYYKDKDSYKLLNEYYNEIEKQEKTTNNNIIHVNDEDDKTEYLEPTEYIDENLSIEQTEKQLIKKALSRHQGKRKLAARDLGISERTLYRKINEYNINE